MKFKYINIEFIFLILPLIFILGSFVTNLSIILLAVTIFFFKEKNWKLNSYELILFLFIVYIFLQTLYFQNYDAIPRVLLFSFYFYIFISARFLKLKFYKSNNLSLILYIFLITLFIFFIYYLIFKFDIKSIERFSAFFGDEKILGSYLSKFCLLIFNLYFFSKHKKSMNILFIFYLLSCSLFTIFSVERMALLIFFLNILLYFSLQKKYLHLVVILTTILSLAFSIFTFVPTSKNHFYNFIGDTGLFQKFSHKYSTSAIRNQTYLDKPKTFINSYVNEDGVFHSPYALNVTKKRLDDRSNNINQDKIIYFFDNFHGSIILNAFTILKDNYLFGVGIKKFREICEKQVLKLNGVDYILECSTHPHNIYIEILVETGIIGLFFILTFFVIFLLKIIKNFDYRSNLNCSLFSLFLIITFPLQSTGSFFSSRYIFFYFITFVFINFFIIREKK